MHLVSIEILQLFIPFRFPYGHAKARHQGVNSILCIARDNQGREGYGEAVPRAYVTGESVESIRRDVPDLLRHIRSGSAEDVQTALGDIEESCPNAVPAGAMCALELAITDLSARCANRSILKMPANEPPSPLTYTASIGMGSPAKLTALVLFYKAMGLRRFKVKVGDDTDLARVRLVRRILGREVSLFVDANGAWDRETAAARIERLVEENVWAVEEPLKVAEPSEARSASGQLCRGEEISDRHLSDNAWLQARIPVPMIADESLISLGGAQRIVDAGAFQIFNIRLSKCGGYGRSSRFAALARQSGLSFSVGAMVGESPVLAAAGAAWGASHPEHLYIQGHSHRLLHGVRFVDGCPPMRRGGTCVPNQKMPGSGLSLNPAALESLVRQRDRYNL